MDDITIYTQFPGYVIWDFRMVPVWNLENYKKQGGEGCTERSRRLLCLGEESASSIVEIPRNTEVERGAPEEQMGERGNSNKEDPDCEKCY
jgi:hypothetical protein